MTDEDVTERQERYTRHMARFIEAHKDHAVGPLLIELERRERWPKIMGAVADVLPPPALEEIEAHAQRLSAEPLDSR